jgi:hypothetical protein
MSKKVCIIVVVILSSSLMIVYGMHSKFSQVLAEPTPVVQSRANSKKLEVKGFYYGLTKTEVGNVHWFLELDSNATVGKLYLPPSILSVSRIAIDPAGNTTFQIEDNSRTVATFNGQLTKDIKGKFVYVDGRQFETELTRIDEKWFSREEAVHAGLYSNVKYVEEAGDLVGAELLLIPKESGLGGSLTIYEGVPGVAYALSDIQIVGRHISFEIVTSGGKRKYSGQLGPRELSIERLNTDEIVSKFRLPKRHDVSDTFEAGTTVP